MASKIASTSKRIIPLLDRVLVQRVKAAERTASGIFIPEKSQETLNEGVVIAVGPGAPDKDGNIRPVSVKEGERILLPPYGGNTVKMGQDEYILFRDNEILAKLAESK
ncbi:10 kDa heat shock protein [Quaeritorhiza haematococci]|nr:10 kDa heat shock protein [Quaeritorhiza haematococci]